MQKKTIKLALALAFGLTAVNAQAAVTLTFSNGTAATAAAGVCGGVAWTAGSEFRVCDPTGNGIAGGGQKNGMNGGETWTFNDAGQMTGVSGTPTNDGATTYPGSAAPNAGTNPALQQAALFFNAPFKFLAPTLGSLAGNTYGPGAFLGGAPVNGTTTLVHFNALEAQWTGSHFPLGTSGGTGIDFTGVISGVSTMGNTTTFNFELFANDLITASEDQSNSFVGNTAQWHFQGTGVHTAVPVPAAVWLLGSGLIGLVGVARRKKAA